jgi:hypothetical protein
MMCAWLEVDGAPGDVAMRPRIWERVALDDARPMVLSGDDAALALAFDRGEGDVRLDIARSGDRWLLRPRVKDVYRNGVVLVANERYPLENGDRIEVMRGLWLRFLDDSTPLPLPRLRQLGSHTFLFAPSPVDGADRWRALVRGSDELFVAIRSHTRAAEEQLEAAFPSFVRFLGTPAGMFALLRDAAGVTLADVLDRTEREGAALDDTLAAAMARAVDAARDHAASAGFRAPPLQEDVVITWEGRVRWLGLRGVVDGRTVPRSQRDPFALVETAAAESAATEDEEEIRRAWMGTLAALFPEERAAEMSLREEVALWTRDGLADLERATRGRPSP